MILCDFLFELEVEVLLLARLHFGLSAPHLHHYDRLDVLVLLGLERLHFYRVSHAKGLHLLPQVRNLSL